MTKEIIRFGSKKAENKHGETGELVINYLDAAKLIFPEVKTFKDLDNVKRSLNGEMSAAVFKPGIEKPRIRIRRNWYSSIIEDKYTINIVDEIANPSHKSLNKRIILEQRIHPNTSERKCYLRKPADNIKYINIVNKVFSETSQIEGSSIWSTSINHLKREFVSDGNKWNRCF